MNNEMINSIELRQKCAEKLRVQIPTAAKMTAFIGMDGFIDEIIHVIDKRTSPMEYSRLNTISKFAERIQAAGGKSSRNRPCARRFRLSAKTPPRRPPR